MRLKSLSLSDFRNYGALTLSFDEGTNILYGDNAQGKTNLLEAIFLSCTTKSHKGSKDSELIRFGAGEAHVRTMIDKEGATYRVDMHLRRGKAKGIALDGVKMRRASEFLEKLSVNVILFSPEDLNVIKTGPSARRRFLDLEISQLHHSYLDALNRYRKALEGRGKLLKSAKGNPDAVPAELLDAYDEPLVEAGVRIIGERERFLEALNGIASGVHARLTNERESLRFVYEPGVRADEFKESLRLSRKRDVFTGQTTVGPHRDDFSFLETPKGEEREVDLRRFGSQGQQRTAALSLKLSEIALVERMTSRKPLLLLDDVLSELDSNRQNALLKTIGGLQTIITCTGLDEFIAGNFAIDRLIRVQAGQVIIQERNGEYHG